MAEVKKRLEAEIRYWAATHPYGILMSQFRAKEKK